MVGERIYLGRQWADRNGMGVTEVVDCAYLPIPIDPVGGWRAEKSGGGAGRQSTRASSVRDGSPVVTC